MRPASAVRFLPRFAAEELLPVIVEELGRGDDATRLAAADWVLTRQDARSWSRLLGGAGIDTNTLARGVRSADPNIRAATYGALISKEGRLDPAVAEAVATAPEASNGSDGLSALLHQLLQRQATGTKPGGLEARVRALGGDPVLVSPDVLRLLSKSEREALSAAASDGERKDLFDHVPEKRRTPARKVPRVGSIVTLPAGLVTEVMRAADCRPSGRTLTLAEATYDEVGRPRRLALAATAGSPACRRAMTVLARLEVPSGRTAQGDTDGVFIRLDEGAGECSVTQSSGPVRHIGGRLREPVKLKNVSPLYPDDAKQGRIQGVVILQAVVTETGCVASVELLRGVHPSLNFEAMAAVMAWRYTPTLLDGKPVPILMTVTVSYS